MNVFIVGTPIQTALALDMRRLNKQIIECKQILKAINGETKAWANHPATLQYKDYTIWLKYYTLCLEDFKNGNIQRAHYWNGIADMLTPEWHTEEYYSHMKRRLYTKDKVHYAQWRNLGESDVNMYYVNGEWKYYRNGKQIKRKGEV